MQTPLRASAWPTFDDWDDTLLSALQQIHAQLEQDYAANLFDLSRPLLTSSTLAPQGEGLALPPLVSVETLMGEHGFPVPAQLSDLPDYPDNLKLAMEALLRHRFRLATYVEQLLTPEDIALIKAQIQLYRGENAASLFDQLADNTLDGWTPAMLQQYPACANLLVFQTQAASGFSQQLLIALGWYGALPLQQSCAATVALLLEKACALDIDPHADLKGFALDDLKHEGKSYAQINQAIDAHLGEYRFAPLRTRWLHAHYPAGLQNPGIPPSLAFKTSSTWVRLQHGLLLAEAMQSGGSRQMSFRELLQYPEQVLASPSPEHEGLVAACKIPPLLDWAQANGNLPQTADSSYTVEQIDQAMQLFISQEQALDKAIDQLTTPAPQRLEMARKALAANGIDEKQPYLDVSGYTDAYIQANPLVFSDEKTNSPPYSRYAIDLMASGKIKGDQRDWILPWLRGHDGRFYRPFLREQAMPDIPAQFDSAFNDWWEQSLQAIDVMVHALLQDLPIDERTAIANGLVTLHTLRKGNLDGRTIRPGSGDFLGVPGDDSELVARRGFVLHSQHLGHDYFHEIFPYSGLIRRREETQLLIDAVNDQNPQVLPFDWRAYSTGTRLNLNTRSKVILHQLGNYRVAPKGLAHRSERISSHIKRQFALGTKTKARNLCWGQTSFDTPDPLLKFLKTWIIPVWGPAEEYLELSKKPGEQGKKVLIALGLVADAVSIIFPLAKVSGLTARFASKTLTLGLRGALPQLGKAAKAVMTGSYDVLYPLAGSYNLLRSVKSLVLLSGKGVTLLTGAAWRQFQAHGVSLGRRLAAPATGQHRATLLTHHAHSRAQVDGAVDQMIFTDHHRLPERPANHLVDPHTSRAYGPTLKTSAAEGAFTLNYPDSLPVSHIDGVAVMPDPDPLLPSRLIQQGFDVFLDNGGLRYQLKTTNGVSVMHRVRLIDESNALKLVRTAPCRIGRGVTMTLCTPDTVKSADHSTVPVTNTSGRDITPWFPDVLIQMRSSKTYVHSRHVWAISGESVKQQSRRKMPPTVYKSDVTAEVLGGNDLFKRVRIEGGIVDDIDDSREVSAVVATYKNSDRMEIVTRADDNVFYSAPYATGQTSISFKRIEPAPNCDTNPTTDADYLALIFAGAFDAHTYMKRLAPEVIEADLARIQRIIDEGGAPEIQKMVGGPFDMGTTEAQAALFCLYARRAITLDPRVPDGVWKPLSREVPVEVRTGIAEQINRLLMSPAFTADSILEPGATLKMSPARKNLAYVKITPKDPKEPHKVYYAVSGYKDRSSEVALGKVKASDQEVAGWRFSGNVAIASDNTHYINARKARPRAQAAANPEEAIFLPDLSAPAVLNAKGNHRLLDSEHMIINKLNDEAIDWTGVASAELFSSLPTCPSCTLGLQELKNKLPEGQFTVFEGTR